MLEIKGRKPDVVFRASGTLEDTLLETYEAIGTVYREVREHMGEDAADFFKKMVQGAVGNPTSNMWR